MGGWPMGAAPWLEPGNDVGESGSGPADPTADVGAARIVYDASTGNLYYDADGGSSANRTLFAVLDNKPPLAALDYNDFRVYEL